MIKKSNELNIKFYIKEGTIRYLEEEVKSNIIDIKEKLEKFVKERQLLIESSKDGYKILISNIFPLYLEYNRALRGNLPNLEEIRKNCLLKRKELEREIEKIEEEEIIIDFMCKIESLLYLISLIAFEESYVNKILEKRSALIEENGEIREQIKIEERREIREQIESLLA